MPAFKPGGGSPLNLIGVDWELIDTPTGDWNLVAVAYSPDLDLWVAVSNTGTVGWANQRAITSQTADSNDWTQRALVDGAWSSVTWSPVLGLFAATRQGNNTAQIATSPDGITWTVRTTPAQTVTLQDIVAGKDKFVAVGATASDASLNLGFWSSDGITWNNISAGNNSQWRAIAYSPELDTYVAVAQTGSGGQSRVMQSDAGTSFVLRSTPSTRNWTDVTWAAALGLFIACDSANNYITSPDGISWTEQQIDGAAATNVWDGLAWSPVYSRLYAVSQSGAGERAAYTANASGNWAMQDPPNTLIPWHDIAWGKDFFVAVGGQNSNIGMMRSCARFSTA